jgi:Holliday junction resolvase RusA-like endonuclease
MSVILRLALPIPPSVNQWKTPIVRGNKATLIETSEFREWKLQARALIGKHLGAIVPFRRPLGVVVEIFRPRKAGDADGYLKVIFDGINKVVWLDDSQICAINIRRYDSPDSPCVTLMVREVAQIKRPQNRPPPAMLVDAVKTSRQLAEKRRAKNQARQAKKKTGLPRDLKSMATSATYLRK